MITGLEILGGGLNLLYVIFLIREKIICWPLGIAGSLISIYIFVDSRLYSEAVLYSYYVGIGIWAWIHWYRREQSQENLITRYTPFSHLRLILVAGAGALLLGGFFAEYSDAQRPYVDALTTCFAFAATYMEVRKVLESWVYWIAVNLTTLWLYQQQQLDVYAALMVVYAALSVWGLVRWSQVYRLQPGMLADPVQKP